MNGMRTEWVANPLYVIANTEGLITLFSTGDVACTWTNIARSITMVK